jgi:tetratricopeptide (TPR) repeat protein
MKSISRAVTVSSFLSCGFAFPLLLLVLPVQRASGKESGGCEGVAFSKRDPKQYTPTALQERIARDPADVDALIHLGLRMEELGQAEGADDLYLRAIQARPQCYLGYYFAGLVEERIGNHLGRESVRKINKAVGLDPDLRNDPNVKAFLARHPTQTRDPATQGGPCEDFRHPGNP